MKRKKTFEDMLDVTAESVRDLMGWCITIALHQEFGIGSARLKKLDARQRELCTENLAIVTTPGPDGRPQAAKAERLRREGVPDGVQAEFRVPMLRAPRTRREEQYKIAGDRMATMTWQLYARACADVLGFGAQRLNRLHAETRKNYEQVNEEASTAGIDVAMEHLRRCARDAWRDETIVAADTDDDAWLEEQERELTKQKELFARRLIWDEVAKQKAAKMPGAMLAAPDDAMRKFEAARAAAMQQPLTAGRWPKR